MNNAPGQGDNMKAGEFLTKDVRLKQMGYNKSSHFTLGSTDRVPNSLQQQAD